MARARARSRRDRDRADREPLHHPLGATTMTNDLAQRLAAAAIRKATAERALTDTESRAGGIAAGREARTELSQASQALAETIAEAGGSIPARAARSELSQASAELQAAIAEVR